MPAPDQAQPVADSANRVQWTVAAAAPAIGPMRRRVMSWLAARGASTAVQEDVALVASELLSNAVRAARGPEGDIRIQVVGSSDGWKLTVADRGVGVRRPRPHPGVGPATQAGRPLNSALNIEGRGLAVVRHVAGGVSIERKRSGWTVVSAVVPAVRRDEVTSQGSGPSSR
jgi:anti-sigma regulatory factor (Ser/Thr protein kinase)